MRSKLITVVEKYTESVDRAKKQVRTFQHVFFSCFPSFFLGFFFYIFLSFRRRQQQQQLEQREKKIVVNNHRWKLCEANVYE